MKKNWPLLVLTVVYLLFLGHFVASNYVQAIGPNVRVIPSRPCVHDGSACAHSCPLFANNPPVILDENDDSNKKAYFKNLGFPFEVHYLDKNWCLGMSVIRTIQTAKQLNASYIITVTVIFAGAGYLLIRSKRKEAING